MIWEHMVSEIGHEGMVSQSTGVACCEGDEAAGSP